ncbi:hypothetical protein Tco_0052696 [Tanacetum coccineum]
MIQHVLKGMNDNNNGGVKPSISGQSGGGRSDSFKGGSHSDSCAGGEKAVDLPHVSDIFQDIRFPSGIVQVQQNQNLNQQSSSISGHSGDQAVQNHMIQQGFPVRLALRRVFAHRVVFSSGATCQVVAVVLLLFVRGRVGSRYGVSPAFLQGPGGRLCHLSCDPVSSSGLAFFVVRGIAGQRRISRSFNVFTHVGLGVGPTPDYFPTLGSLVTSLRMGSLTMMNLAGRGIGAVVYRVPELKDDQILKISLRFLDSEDTTTGLLFTFHLSAISFLERLQNPF